VTQRHVPVLSATRCGSLNRLVSYIILAEVPNLVPIGTAGPRQHNRPDPAGHLKIFISLRTLREGQRLHTP
jgi:hypothetical protein